MARSINRLSALQVKNAIAKMLHDGGGLYLQTTKSGTKSWSFRYMLNGKSREMGLGPLSIVPLSKARDKALECRKLCIEGIDPISNKKATKSKIQSQSISFRECAQKVIALKKPEWKNKKHTSQWTNTLEQYAFPFIGDMHVKDIEITDVLQCLEPIWRKKTETATRVRSRIENILDWASTHSYRTSENPARWKGHLENTLPNPTKLKNVKHHKALPYEKAPEFIDNLHKRNGVSALALEFTILTATRTNEALGAKWEEIDLENKLWEIPEIRMKGAKAHKVPLSDQAISVLEKTPRMTSSCFVFPGMKDNAHLSNMSMLMMIRKMGFNNITTHGFRSTFKDWAAETTSHPNIVSEAALAHTIKNQAEAAYRRGNLLDKRKKLMQDWANFLDQLSPQ